MGAGRVHRAGRHGLAAEHPRPAAPRRLGLGADGIDTLVGCELEFTLFDADGTMGGPWSAYGLGPVLADAGSGFLRDLATLAETTGLPLDQAHAEYGTRQFEISLGPTDPLTAADNVVLARILIGRAAERHGFRPSFSPLSSTEANAANGAHQHFSFTRDGASLFSGGTGPHGIRPEGGAAIAGLLRRLPEFIGFHAGSLLSGARLLPGHWSGAHACWGLENREAAVRFCAATAGNPHGASVELKVVDASANPYLSIAAMLWAAHEGIRDELALPVEVTGDPAALPAGAAVPLLPNEQSEVLAVLGASTAAVDFAGEDIMTALLAVRGHEVEVYGAASAAALAERFRFTWSM